MSNKMTSDGRLLVLLAALFITPTMTRAETSPSGGSRFASHHAKIKEVVAAAMERHGVPGAGIAVVDDYRIDWVEGFGLRSEDLEDPVGTTTLFQAASISKPLTALAVLKLVEERRLDLNADIDAQLKSWHIPASPLLRDRPVTVRGLLSHSAGVTVHGFPGYPTDTARPSLVEILDGTKPANTGPIRVDIKPGYLFRYSGGGYCIVQQWVLDVTGQSFPEFMSQQVLRPLAMADSTYQQPLPNELAARAAYGHRARRKVIAGHYHVYPEMAAAGLWTTPGDLGKVVIDLSKSLARGDGRLLSQEAAKEMVTVQKGSCGLGIFVAEKAEQRSFTHDGANEGYRCQMVGFPATGRGLVIMTNSNTGGAIFDDVTQAVATAYQWP